MKQIPLVGSNVRMVLKDNIIAVMSDEELSTVSSAIYNGGARKARTILNIQVPEGYSDLLLHNNPFKLVFDSAEKLGVTGEFIAMITAAIVNNFSLATKKDGDTTVNVIVTAGCSHAESAGELIDAKVTDEGTINTIIVIDGNPTESCLVGCLVTAVEAKVTAMRELDIRSRYSGDPATGTVTDAIVVAATNRGTPIYLGGPASKLGQIVAYCTKQAIKETVAKENANIPHRSILQRLQNRHLPVEKLAFELAKSKSLHLDEKTLTVKLTKILTDDPLLASIVLAASKLDEDISKGIVPPEIKDTDAVSKEFGNLLLQTKNNNNVNPGEDYSAVDLPPFIKYALINIVKSKVSGGKTENLK